MTPEISFITPNVVASVGSAIVALLAGSGIAAIAVPQISKFVIPKPKETYLSDFIPMKILEEDGKTIRCEDDTICQLIEIVGVDQSFLNHGEALSVASARKNMIDALTEQKVTLRIFTIREPIEITPSTDYPNEYAKEIAERWNKNFRNTYRTRNIIMVSMKDPKNKGSIDEVVSTIESILDNYQPKVLTQNPNDSPNKDMTIGKFLGKLVSPITQPEPKFYGNHLAEALTADQVTFCKNGNILFEAGDEKKYCSVIGIKKIGDDINTQMAAELSSIPGELIIMQTIVPQSKAETLIKLKQNQRMAMSSSFSSDVWAQYQLAIAMVEGLDEGKSALCNFSETIYLYHETEDGLKNLERTCRQILNHHGNTPVKEKGATQASWFSQFPSFDLIPRVYRLFSAQIALAATFDKPATGLSKSDWGQGPIALFNTGSNTVYSHQFHISTEEGATGHGICIAPTGAGKTVLMEFLSCMTSRHKDVKHFFFDRYQGTYCYTTAMGGKYLGFNANHFTQSISGGMNPFQCDETNENKEFLKVWLQGISGCNDHDSVEQISNAIEIAFSTLDYDERSLANIYDGSFTPRSKIYEALQKWVDPNQYGEMFNSIKDCIDLDDNWLTTFDMTRLLDDEKLARASISYIMHRIRQSMSKNQSPGFIFIDETGPLLKDETFKKMYLVMLQEFRKIRGSIISVFQRPEALNEAGVSDLVRQQCSAYYLFPNPGAQASDYKDFDLTNKELDFILGHYKPSRQMKRALLIKKPMIRESIIIDIDLKDPLGNYLKLFSSNGTDVKLASDFQRQYGNEKEWIEKYISHQKA